MTDFRGRATHGDALYRQCPVCGGPYKVGERLEHRELPDRRKPPFRRRLTDIIPKRLVVGHAYCSPKAEEAT